MKPSAALLIDLENFYLSRIDYFNDENFRAEDRPSFSDDLKNLVRHAQRMAGLPFAVKRAYADFDSLNVNHQDLMRQGVEPVQVFRLSGKTGNKNAADMKLAMDAVALLEAGGPVEHFVLVSGDADFIPVILELKRRGHSVSVIAVTGATNELIQRFVDQFELFENLGTGTERRERGAPEELPRIAAALRRVLVARAKPIRFNVVQPLLSKELGGPFDPTAYGCASTGEFLRKNFVALGVVIRGTQNDQEIDLPGAAPAGSNGTAARAASRQTPRAVPVATHEPHSAAHYKYLLASGRADANEARVITIPWASLVWVCDAVVPALTPPTGEPCGSIQLMPRLQTAARATDTPDLAAHVALMYSAVRSALPVPSPDGVYSLPADTTGEQVRGRVLRYVLYVLGRRLVENGVPDPIRPESVAAMFEPGPATEQAVAEVRAALAAEAAAEPPAAPVAGAKPLPRADVSHLHTPDVYRKLLQKGGPRGSGEAEHLRIHTAPWPSVERACADAFAALTPAGTSLQRGQFLERLYAGDKEMRVDNYRSHMRRAFALLGLSHAILEEGDRVTLHPEVRDASDIRWAVLGTMLQLLAVRLSEKGVGDPIRPDVFLAAIEAGPFTDEMLPEIARAIEVMYEPDQTDPDPVTAEPAPAGPEQFAQLEVVAEETSATVLVPDDGPVTAELVSVELVTEEPFANEPVPDEPPPDASRAEYVDRDPYAFDGALPDHATPAAGAPEPAPVPLPVEEPPAPVTAAVVEPAVQVLPPAPSATPQPVPSDPDMVVFAPPLEVVPAPVAGARRPDDELPLEAPAAEWLTDDDSIFSGPEFTERITERLTGSSTRLAPPRPLEPDDDDVLFSDPDTAAERITERLTGSSTRLAPRLLPPESRVPIAKIKSPPPPPSVMKPPPLPPSPPESA